MGSDDDLPNFDEFTLQHGTQRDASCGIHVKSLLRAKFNLCVVYQRTRRSGSVVSEGAVKPLSVSLPKRFVCPPTLASVKMGERGKMGHELASLPTIVELDGRPTSTRISKDRIYYRGRRER
jgi:hypothetical protein